MERTEDVLKGIYYDESHPASFGGVGKLFKAAKKTVPRLKRSTVRDWLRGQDAYTLHRETSQKFVQDGKQLSVRPDNSCKLI